MGMAASQARLLAITARMHDVEYQAQSIQNAKVQLATKSDQVYQDYLEALDATTLTARNADGERVVVNFRQLCGKNAVQVQGNALYAMYNERGRLIVEDELLAGYEQYLDNGGIEDPYLFAMYMMGIENGEEDVGDIQSARSSVVYQTSDESVWNTIESMKKILSSYTDEYAEISQTSEDPDLLEDMLDAEYIFSEVMTYDNDYVSENDDYDEPQEKPRSKVQQDREDYQKCLDSINYKIFNKYASTINNMSSEDSEMDEESVDISALDINDDFDYDTFNYYVRRFQLIQQAGGAVGVSAYDGFNGDASTDGDWLQDMLKSGRITIDLVKFSTKDGSIAKANSGVSSDTYLDYTTSSLVDKTKVAKAEAEYEHKMKDINTKDKRFDMDLSKLETERTALKTEYDSVKKVIQDNIERTFGIFS